MSVAIRWVNKSFKDFLEDIIEDPDSDENVPLVPIDADCIMAIGNMEFKLFLKQLGVLPPGMQVRELLHLLWNGAIGCMFMFSNSIFPFCRKHTGVFRLG